MKEITSVKRNSKRRVSKMKCYVCEKIVQLKPKDSVGVNVAYLNLMDEEVHNLTDEYLLPDEDIAEPLYVILCWRCYELWEKLKRKKEGCINLTEEQFRSFLLRFLTELRKSTGENWDAR